MIPIEEEMRGKVAVITGANTGIGLGCAKVFSEAGMNVVLAARRKERERPPPRSSTPPERVSAPSFSAMYPTPIR